MNAYRLNFWFRNLKHVKTMHVSKIHIPSIFKIGKRINATEVRIWHIGKDGYNQFLEIIKLDKHGI